MLQNTKTKQQKSENEEKKSFIGLAPETLLTKENGSKKMN
jgi:hypothetical protein